MWEWLSYRDYELANKQSIDKIQRYIYLINNYNVIYACYSKVLPLISNFNNSEIIFGSSKAFIINNYYTNLFRGGGGDSEF